MKINPILTLGPMVRDVEYIDTAKWINENKDNYKFKIYYKDGRYTQKLNIKKVDMEGYYINHAPNPKDSKIIYCPLIEIRGVMNYITNINIIEVYRKDC